LTKYVVDANVAVKWVLEEIHSETASRLLNDSHTLLVPDFFFCEVGNILWKQVRFGTATLEEAEFNFNQITMTPIQVYQSKFLVLSALKIAVRVQQAIYDCVYLALAVSQGCKMVTADERFVNALQGDVLATYLCWVEDLP
jgi:predicted nucleic acid-binding protein